MSGLLLLLCPCSGTTFLVFAGEGDVRNTDIQYNFSDLEVLVLPYQGGLLELLAFPPVGFELCIFTFTNVTVPRDSNCRMNTSDYILMLCVSAAYPEIRTAFVYTLLL